MRRVGGRWFPRTGLALAIGLVVPPGRDALAQFPGDGGWVGRRVVQRSKNFSPKINDDGSDHPQGRSRIDIYRVQRVEGGRLYLHAPGIDGWTTPDEVVTVEQGIDHYTQVIRDEPDDPHGFTMRATLHHRIRRDLDAALQDYDGAVRVAPNAAHVYNNRANVHVARRDYDLAIRDYGESIRINPRNPMNYSNRGTAWASKKQLHRAIEDFDRALALDPTFTMALVHRGDADRALKDDDQAILDFDAALQIDPKLVAALVGRGAAKIDKKQIPAGLLDFDEAVRVDPASPNPLVARGHALVGLRRYDQAIRDFDAALRIDPRYPQALNDRGTARRALGDPDGAIRDFDAALRVDPRSPFTFNNRAIAHQDKHDPDLALADFDNAIQAGPHLGLAYRNRAVLRFLLGRPGGESDARDALARDGWWDVTSLYHILVGHFAARREGRPDAARGLLDDAFARSDIESWPYPVIRFLRHEIEADALLALADDDDKKTEAHCYLGLDLDLAGHPDQARPHYQWVRDHGTPTFMEYTIARARLDAEAPPIQTSRRN